MFVWSDMVRQIVAEMLGSVGEAMPKGTPMARTTPSVLAKA